jgi:hypothetical protein
MYKEILSSKQQELLPLLQAFKREFYLVGGTAIALHIGHRRSIDFDLFKKGHLNISRILGKISQLNLSYIVTRRVEEQLNLIMNEVKITFFDYPYPVAATCKFEDIIKIPDLLQLSAMKAFALGRRSKWKDYIDLYYILKEYYSVNEIVCSADSIFGQLFSEKLFRAQLSYFEDIDYSEPVELLRGEISPVEVKEFLIGKAIDLRKE